MIKLFSQYKAVILAIILFLSGVFNASAATQTAPVTATQAGAGYYYKAYERALIGSNGPIQQFGPYPTVTDCQKAWDAQYAANSSYTITSSCSFQSSSVAAAQSLQQSQALSTKQKAIVAAAGSTGSQDPQAIEKLKCADWSGIHISGCIAIGVYYVIYKPISYGLMGSGIFFDKALELSLNRDFINQNFVTNMWTVIRDFSNMLFIFVLLYTGIQTMLFGKDWMRTVITVIVVALLINFSLFFTKIIIDAGNILAVGIRDSILTKGTISESIADAFSPQAFIDTAGKALDPVDAIVVFLIAAAVSAYVAIIFLKVAIMFVGRLLGFWYLMIISPFAFVSTTVPKWNMFNRWLGELFNLSFVAPVFIFGLYVIMQIIAAKDGILGGIAVSTGTFWFDKIFVPVIVAVFITQALDKVLNMSKGMAGEFGDWGSKTVGTALGVAGLAAGGAGLAGRAIGGRIGASMLEGDKLKQMTTSESAFARFAGRTGIQLAEKAQTGTWDLRGVGAISKTLKAGGAKDVMGFGGAQVGASAAGGYKAAVEKQAKKDKEFVEKWGTVSETEKKEIEEKLKAEEKTAKEAHEAYEKSEAGKAEVQNIKEAAARKDAQEKVTKEKAEVLAKAQVAARAEMKASGKLSPAVEKALKEAEAEKMKAEAEFEEFKEELKVAEKAKEESATAKAYREATIALKTTVADETARRTAFAAQDVNSVARHAVKMATNPHIYSRAQSQEKVEKLRAEAQKKADKAHKDAEKALTAEGKKELEEEAKENKRLKAIEKMAKDIAKGESK